MLHLAVSVLSLGFLVLLHEAGHFLVARACRMRVEVFSVGFGPALLSYRGKQTEYRLSMVPLGGYVRIAGMSYADFPPDDPAGFHARPAWQRALVLVAGPALNWVFAFVLLTTLYVVGFRVGTGQPVIAEVRGRAAAAAGLLPGDRVLEVDGEVVSSWGELTRALGVHRGTPAELTVLRNDVQLALVARPGTDGRLGITPESRILQFPFGESVQLAAGKTTELVAGMLGMLRDGLLGRSAVELIGPVGIVTETVEAVRKDFLALFLILVQISLALAVMNLLPLPALDGGRLAFVLVGALRRRPLDLRVETVVHALGVLVLLGVVAVVSFTELRTALQRPEPAVDAGGEAPATAGALSDVPDASLSGDSGAL